MMKRLIGCVLPCIFCCVLGSAAQGAEDNANGVVVMDVQVLRGLDQGLALVLNEALLSVVRESKAFSSVIGGSDLRSMMSQEMNRQSLGCDDSGCLAEIGGALGVPLLIATSIGRVGAGIAVSVKLIAVEEAKVLGRSTIVAKGEDELIGAIEKGVNAITGGLGSESNTVLLWTKRNWLPLSVAGGGAVLSLVGQRMATQNQTEFNTADRPLTRAAIDRARDGETTAQAVWIAGLAGVAGAVGIWWFQ